MLITGLGDALFVDDEDNDEEYEVDEVVEETDDDSYEYEETDDDSDYE